MNCPLFRVVSVSMFGFTSRNLAVHFAGLCAVEVRETDVVDRDVVCDLGNNVKNVYRGVIAFEDEDEHEYADRFEQFD